MERFKNTGVLVTGAAAGIGRATVQRLAEEGARVFCVDVDAEGLGATVASLAPEQRRQAHTRVCDISSEAAVRDCVQDCSEALGGLQVLCNVAGILAYHHCHEMPFEDWQRILGVNLGGTMLMCRFALPQLMKTKGNIVNVASTSAHAGLPWGCAYSASKGGVLALTRSIAVEYASAGVRANSVSPGDIETKMVSEPRFPKGIDFALLNRLRSLDGTRGPEVVAAAIAMLASADGAHLNGADIRVDGGSLS